MRVMGISLVLLGGLCLSPLVASQIIVDVTGLGANSYRYVYHFSGFNFQANQEIDFTFDPLLYSDLSNGVVGTGFNGIMLQPNNPPGSPGEFSVLANVNNPPLTGPFSIDFLYLGAGSPTGQQPFSFNQFDSNGNLVATLDTGQTSSAPSTIPEPHSVLLVAAGLLAMGFALRRSVAATN